MLLFTVILYLNKIIGTFTIIKKPKLEKARSFKLNIKMKLKPYIPSWNLPISNLDVFADFYEF